jgi:hypothetical protein
MSVPKPTRLGTSFVLVLSSLLPLTPLPTPALQDLPKIQGSVLNIAAGKGISGTEVRCGNLTALSDSGGKFSLVAPQEMQCKLQVRAPGFCPAPGVERSLRISANSSPRQLRLDMIAFASLQGGVQDREGKPQSGLRIFLAEERSFHGSKVLNQVQETASGKDGAFRFAEVRPGSYVVLAAVKAQAPPKNAAGRTLPVHTFYPSSAELAGAQRIVLRPGMQQHNIDIQLLELPRYTLQGKLVNLPATMNPKRDVNLVLRHSLARDSKLQGTLDAALGSAAAYVEIDEDGAFTLSGVPPGMFFVNYSLSFGWNTGPSIEIFDKDLDKVFVDIKPAFPLHLRVELEEDSEKFKVPLFLGISRLGPENNFISLIIQDNLEAKSKAVPAGNHQFTFTAKPQSYFVKRLKVNGDQKDPMNFPLAGFGEYKLEVLLSKRLARVSGSVDGDASLVTISPEPLTLLDSSFRILQTEVDGNGTFAPVPLQPGTYRACAWNIPFLEAFHLLSNDKKKAQLESGCETLEVGENESKTLRLKLLSFAD